GEGVWGTGGWGDGGGWRAAGRRAAAEAVAGGRQHAGLLAARIAQAAGSGEVPDPADLPWATALADQRRAEAETAQRAALRRQAELDQAAAALEDARALARRQQRRQAALTEQHRLDAEAPTAAAMP